MHFQTYEKNREKENFDVLFFVVSDGNKVMKSIFLHMKPSCF